ncbi:MAG TPA: alkaline phosphatase family protein [Solirubrobacteraceae bacterium]|nr:alkaline phosphatase family protein [Solirubrobacteraceae bacterium]
MDEIRDPAAAERFETEHPEAFHTRRDFLMRTAAAAGLGAGAGLMLDPDTVLAAAAKGQRRAKLPAARNMPIDTFVVLMMENRSFDHYLGWLPGADGRQAGLSFTDKHGAKHKTHRLADFYQSCGFLDPDHSWDGGRTELDRGKMNGFLKAASDTFAIGYYAEPDLPFTPHNAKAFTTFDRFFCSILSSTYPNREYMHAAQSYGEKDNSLPSGAGFPDTTIFAAMSKKGISNRYYYTDIPVSALWGAPGLARSSQVQEFYAACETGTLPHLSFVDPSFQGEEQGTSGDEHPLADVRIRRSWPMWSTRSCSLRSGRGRRCSACTTSGEGSSTTSSPRGFPTCAPAAAWPTTSDRWDSASRQSWSRPTPGADMSTTRSMGSSRSSR